VSWDHEKRDGLQTIWPERLLRGELWRNDGLRVRERERERLGDGSFSFTGSAG